MGGGGGKEPIDWGDTKEGGGRNLKTGATLRRGGGGEEPIDWGNPKERGGEGTYKVG